MNVDTGVSMTATADSRTLYTPYPIDAAVT